MKRCAGWILAVVLVVSLLAAPVASAQVERADGPSAWTSWADVLFGWLAGLLEGEPELPTGNGDAPEQSGGDTGPAIEPVG